VSKAANAKVQKVKTIEFYICLLVSWPCTFDYARLYPLKELSFYLRILKQVLAH
jgi:Zn-finger protein